MILVTLSHAQGSSVQIVHILLLLHLPGVCACLPSHARAGQQTMCRSRCLYVGPRNLVQLDKRANGCLFPNAGPDLLILI